MKSKNVVLIWGIVLILLLCCGCMNGGLLGASDDSSAKLHTVTINNSHSKLQIDIPFELKSIDSPKYGELEEYVDKKINSIGENDLLIVHIVGIGINKEYYREKNGFEFETTLKGMADGAIQDIKDIKNTSDFKLIDTDFVEINNIKMRKIKASYVYHYNGKSTKMFVDEVVFKKNEDMWNVCVVAFDDDETTKKMVKSILESIKTK